MKEKTSKKFTNADHESDPSNLRSEFESSTYPSETSGTGTDDAYIEGFTTGFEESLASPSEHYEPFILGSPIPNPKKLDNEKFKTQIIDWFYQVIRLHTEHMYSERSNEIIGKILVNNVEQLDPKQGEFLTEWFLDNRFMSLFSLFQNRIYQPSEIQNLVKRVAEKYRSTQEASYEIVTIPHGQLWGTFINRGDPSSLVNILLKLVEKGIQLTNESEEVLQQIKISLEKGFPKLDSDAEIKVEEEGNRALSDAIISEFFDRIINDIELRVIDLCFSLIRGEIAKRVANCIENHPELLPYLKEQKEISNLIKRGIIQAEIYPPQKERVQRFTNTSLLTLARKTQNQANIAAVETEKRETTFSKWDPLHIIVGGLLIGAGAIIAVFLVFGTFGLALIPTAIVAVAAGATSAIGVLEGLRGMWKKISSRFSRFFKKKNKNKPAASSQKDEEVCRLESREEENFNVEPLMSAEEEKVKDEVKENQALLDAIVLHLKDNPSLALPVIKKLLQEASNDLPELDFLRHFFDIVFTHRFKGLRDLKVVDLEQSMIHFFATFLTTLSELCKESSRTSDDVIKTLDSSFEDEDLVQALGKISTNELSILKQVHERLLALTKEETDIAKQAKKLTSLFMPVYANILTHNASGEISEKQLQLCFKSLSETSKQVAPARSVSRTVLAQTLDAVGGTRQDHKGKEEEIIRDHEGIDIMIKHGSGVFLALGSENQTPTNEASAAEKHSTEALSQ